MEDAIPMTSSFAALFDPAVVRELAARAARWDLPRRMCRPLDTYAGKRVAAELAAYDDAIDSAPVRGDEINDEPQQQCGVREIDDEEL